MKVETLLPLGKVDPGLRAPEMALDIRKVYDDAQVVERLGYDGLMVEEIKDDPFQVMALAAQATERVQLGTAVAIAFPRSPTITAMSAWTLQKLSGGRFTLGLGPQVKGHIERRYGLKWSPPGTWMREYVLALRAIWNAWQNGGPLEVRGEHYNISLLVPLFTPAPMEHWRIPVHLAAVNPYMCQVAGEVADGVRPHPVCTAEYIREVMLPAVQKGAAKAGRELGNFQVAMKPLVATARTEEQLAIRVRDARARIAFYCSTPAYVAAFEKHGLGDIAREMAVLSKAQRWEEMPGLIDDEVLHRYVTVGTFDEIGRKLIERYAGVVTNIEFSIPVQDARDEATLADLVKLVQAA